MGTRYQHLIDLALDRSLDVRMSAGADVKSPICVFDLCDALSVRLKFVDLNMEGLYVRGRDGTAEILVSSLRPLPRRVFTCGHELGHHVFGHGFSVDQMVERMEETANFDPNEFLVDTFAGFLLMPTIGIRRAFAVRGWRHQTASPEQLFTVACSFGVGYETLIAHMTFSLRMYSQAQRKLLLKDGPKSIRRRILGAESSDPLVIVDDHWQLPTIDLEVGTRVLLPRNTAVAGNHLASERQTPSGNLYRAERPGITRVTNEKSEWAAFVRVSRYQFAGLSRYRHLEEEEDE
jgi:Zn-dependent peptidase ImmA (M78 family)